MSIFYGRYPAVDRLFRFRLRLSSRPLHHYKYSRDELTRCKRSDIRRGANRKFRLCSIMHNFMDANNKFLWRPEDIYIAGHVYKELVWQYEAGEFGPKTKIHPKVIKERIYKGLRDFIHYDTLEESLYGHIAGKMNNKGDKRLVKESIDHCSNVYRKRIGVPNEGDRKVEVLKDDKWVEINFSDLKRYMKFRLFEATGEPVISDGCTEFLATSDAFVGKFGFYTIYTRDLDRKKV